VQNRTIESVLNELREENHVPMVNFVEALNRQEWAARLSYDVSMLRLWIARKGVTRVQVMITYGDGHRGGRPLEPYVDAYELTIFADFKPDQMCTQDSVKTIERLQGWLESQERGKMPSPG
jgi:hypothetical protein